MRVEANYKTKQSIKKELNIDNNQLMTVLNAEGNPLLKIAGEAVRNVNDINFNAANEITNLKELEKQAVIKECDYDMSAVEQLIKTVIPPTTSIGRTLEPYHKVYDKMIKNNIPKIDLHGLISN